MRACIYVPFVSCRGVEYELEIEPSDDGRIHAVGRFVEDERGTVTAEPLGLSWDGLIPMSQDLRVAIVSWRSDPGN